jgi:hypothetical protein
LTWVNLGIPGYTLCFTGNQSTTEQSRKPSRW